MRRVRFSAAVSLDGFLAGPQGQHDWILMDPEIDFPKLMESFDTILMGRKTYEASKQFGGGGMPGMGSLVFSRTLRAADVPGVQLSADPAAAVAELKKQSGKDLWLFGGGQLLRSFLNLGLLDSLELMVIPVLLGEGVPLFPGPFSQVPLKLQSQRVLSQTGTVALEYVPTPVGKKRRMTKS